MSRAGQIAKELTDGAERARLAGDTVASLHLALVAAQYLQLARLLPPDHPRDQKERT